MLHRLAAGHLPAKPHTALYVGPDGAPAAAGDGGRLAHEHCQTRQGFDGAFTIVYRLNAPHVQLAWQRWDGPFNRPEAAPPAELLLRRHYRSQALAAPVATGPLSARVPLFVSDDCVLGVLRPTASDPVYVENGDGDDLYYVQDGGGTLRTLLGDVAFGPGDYVFVPRGLLHRFVLDAGVAQHWFHVEALKDLHVPRQFRNDVGQLKMDAPYTHRDFRAPAFAGPRDEGIRVVVSKREQRLTAYWHAASPLDAVGWDGGVWPWAFPILAFQPKTSSVHLPPTIHGTFAIGGGLVCSFVPRLVDYAPGAIPCPYPHASVHCDEVIFYSRGNFTSRKGVGPGSLSFHPMGTSHGPHPGAYAGSIGATRTDEVAVMLDVFRPLRPTAHALALEDAAYHASFIPPELAAAAAGDGGLR